MSQDDSPRPPTTRPDPGFPYGGNARKARQGMWLLAVFFLASVLPLAGLGLTGALESWWVPAAVVLAIIGIGAVVAALRMDVHD